MGLRERLAAWLLGGSKASRAWGWVPAWQDNQPRWTPRDYAAFVREGYKKVVWVYACVREIATAVSSVPWLLYAYDGQGNAQEVGRHPLLDLLRRPNPFCSWQELVEGWATYLNLAGNAYIELAEQDGRGRPKELYLLRPDRVLVVPSREEYIAGYVYRIDEQDIPLERDEVIHFKYLDPLDDWYGMSPLEAAARTVDTENEAVDWNKVFFQNAARPDGALTTKETLSEEQFNRLKQEIAENWKGTKNAHRPLLLEAGLEWRQMGLSQKDMDFLNLRKMTREEICAVYGVPPVLVGILDRATYSNYEQARRSFWEETVIPTLNRLRDKLNAELVSRFGENLELDYDLSVVPGLAESQAEKIDRLKDAVAIGLLTINEARQELGYDPVSWGNVWWAPANLLPVGEGGGEAAGPWPEEVKALNLRTPEERKAYWKAFDRRRWKWEEKLAEEIRREFEKEREEILRALEGGGADPGFFRG